jgi:hypothetical protein
MRLLSPRRPRLNEGHAYTLSRDALVKMLDQALATARPKR